MPGKIILSETQFLAIANAARALVPNDQPAFFQAVSDELQGKLIGDGTIGQAIRIAQAKFPHPNTAHDPHKSHIKW